MEDMKKIGSITLLKGPLPGSWEALIQDSSWIFMPEPDGTWVAWGGEGEVSHTSPTLVGLVEILDPDLLDPTADLGRGGLADLVGDDGFELGLVELPDRYGVPVDRRQPGHQRQRAGYQQDDHLAFSNSFDHRVLGEDLHVPGMRRPQCVQVPWLLTTFLRMW